MDAEARFRALFDAAYPALHRYARNRGLSGHDAHDLVAATLEVAWRRIDAVPVEDPLPWLYGVARNVWLNRARTQRRYERLIARLAAREATQVAPELPAGDRGALRQALGSLPAADQEILRLVAWDGLTPAQAAVALGCTPVAARARLHKARNRLAAKLGLPRERQRAPRPGQIPSRRPPRVTTTEVHDG